MEIPLNLQAKRSTCLCELREPEVAQLLFKAYDPAEKQVFTIELQRIKCPITIRGEKLTDDEGVFLMFLRVERRKHFPQLVGQQFYGFPSLPLDGKTSYVNAIPKQQKRHSITSISH